jgi:hypothetical protein
VNGREGADEHIAYCNSVKPGSHERHPGAGWCCEFHDGYEAGWDAALEQSTT